MNRNEMIDRLQKNNTSYDFIVIGGGASGLGVAVDAATRGYSVALFEQNDFAKGTSSRSTKLVHGGVRYLAQGDIALVLEALHERGLIGKNAPHLFKNQRFLVPCYRWFDAPMYTVGLILYDLLAGRLGLGRSAYITPSKSRKTIPTLRAAGLSGGVIYHDGQFDDSRLAINLARTATDAGATILNYARVTNLIKTNGKIAGVEVTDQLTGTNHQITAKVVVNATGVFADEILSMDKPGHRPTIKPSQGVHLVFDKEFLESQTAIMIPKTADGRVLFVVPWHDKVVAGTTDTVIDTHSLEPIALEEEIDFILETAGQYMTKKPLRSDVRSVFAGLRPLAAPQGEGKKTKEISRSHKVTREKSGLISLIGGKWTTYRRMAEDTVNVALKQAHLENRPCVTKQLPIHGYRLNPNYTDPLYVFGTDADEIRALEQSSPAMAVPLHPDFAYTVGCVHWIVRNEAAFTVEDILARRLRILFLDSRAAIQMAPTVAQIMAQELNKDSQWKEEQIKIFTKVAANYIL